MVISYKELNFDDAIDVGDASINAACVPMKNNGWYCSLNINDMTGTCYTIDEDGTPDCASVYDIEIADCDIEMVYNKLVSVGIV